MSKNNTDDLAIEIVELSDELEEAKKHNKIARLKCNLTKIRGIAKLGAALTVVPLTSTLITSAFGWNPFKLNDEKETALVTKTINADGEIEENRDYRYVGAISIVPISYAYYYTKWKFTDNGNYMRTVYGAEISSDDIDNILGLTSSSEEISLERFIELFQESISNIKSNNEICAEVSESELKKGSYVTGVIRYYDREDIILVKEKVSSHVSWLVVDIIFEICLMALISAYLFKKTCFFEKVFGEIKYKPNYIDLKKIQQKLKAKQYLFENQQLVGMNPQELDLNSLEEQTDKKIKKMLQ